MIHQLAWLTVAGSPGLNLGLIAPLIGFLAGGGLIFMSIVNGRKSKASLQWPSVPGTVLSSEMVTDRTGDIVTFTPVVRYAYMVNGQPLQSTRVRFSAARGKKIVDKYPRGCPVQVFYDPQAPANAVLERGGSTRAMMFVGVAVFAGFCLFGFVMKGM